MANKEYHEVEEKTALEVLEEYLTKKEVRKIIVAYAQQGLNLKERGLNIISALSWPRWTPTKEGLQYWKKVYSRCVCDRFGTVIETFDSKEEALQFISELPEKQRDKFWINGTFDKKFQLCVK